MFFLKKFLAIPAEKRKDAVIKRRMAENSTHNDNLVEDKLKENNSSLGEKQQGYNGCHFNRQNHS